MGKAIIEFYVTRRKSSRNSLMFHILRTLEAKAKWLISWLLSYPAYKSSPNFPHSARFGQNKWHFWPIYQKLAATTNLPALISLVPVSTISVEAVLGRTVTLPCDIEPEVREDRVYMVLWFRESAGKPLYRWVFICEEINYLFN